MTQRLIFALVVTLLVVGAAIANRLQTQTYRQATDRKSAELREQQASKIVGAGITLSGSNAGHLPAPQIGDEAFALTDRKANSRFSLADYDEVRGSSRNQLSTAAAIGIGFGIGLSALALLALHALTDKASPYRLSKS